jgi:undecaprenyl-diphosphatase
MPEVFDTDTHVRIPAKKAQEKVQSEVRKETASRPQRYFRAILFEAYVILTLIAFGILAALAYSTAYLPIDLTITSGFQAYSPTWFQNFMLAISWFGFPPQAGVIVVFAAAIIFILGYRWEGVMVAISTAVVSLLNLGIKLFVHRPRPSVDLVHVVKVLSSYSFPSGHVMFFTGFFGFLAFLAYTLLKRSVLRTTLLVVFTGMVVLVGPSRIYLGEHWFSDVIGGYLLGSLGLVATIQFYRWGKPRFFAKQPVASEKPGEEKTG